MRQAESEAEKRGRFCLRKTKDYSDKTVSRNAANRLPKVHQSFAAQLPARRILVNKRKFIQQINFIFEHKWSADILSAAVQERSDERQPC